MTPPSIISSRQHPFVKRVRALHAAKGRREQGAFLIEGSNSVAAALQANWPIETLIAAPDTSGATWTKQAQEKSIATQFVESHLLEYLSEAQSATEVLAIARYPSPASEWPDEGALLVLDGIGDPGNAGTLLRAADAAGASAVIATQNSADLFAPKTIRASAGSLFHFAPLFAAPPTAEALIDELHQHRIPIITAQAHNGIDAFAFDWPRRCALILGHETRGISPAFEQAANAHVTIPIDGRAESLNVAMAGTLLLYAWRNRSLKVL